MNRIRGCVYVVTWYQATTVKVKLKSKANMCDFNTFLILLVYPKHIQVAIYKPKDCVSFTTIPVDGLRSSSMMKRYLRAKKVARVDGISMQGYKVGEKSGCHPLGKMLSKSSSFSEFSYKRDILKVSDLQGLRH